MTQPYPTKQWGVLRHSGHCYVTPYHPIVSNNGFCFTAWNLHFFKHGLIILGKSLGKKLISIGMKLTEGHEQNNHNTSTKLCKNKSIPVIILEGVDVFFF